MLIIRPTPPFLRHPRVNPVPPMPAGPLTLLSATIVDFSGADAIVEMVFDNTADDPIVNIEATVGTNWTATIEGYLFGGNTPLELTMFNTITLYMGNAGESSGANRISYAADPSDIGTASGRMLAAFSDRILTGL